MIMLDINRIRENPEAVKEALKKKLWDHSVGFHMSSGKD